MHRRTALLTAAAMTAAVVPAGLAVASSGNGTPPAHYLVGGAAESINPTQAMIDARDFFLGGYGFGSGRVANVVEVPTLSGALGNRYATGILADNDPQFGGADGDGVHSRSLAIADGRGAGHHTIVLSQIETQGYFDAYKQGPFGENEIRKDASAAIAKLVSDEAAAHHDNGAGNDAPPVPSPSQIIVDSDHSHGGPDTAGVWGGVPTSYLKEVHDQTVASIVEAWQRMQPATLKYGVAHAGVDGEGAYPPQECIDAGGCTNLPAGQSPDWLMTNQFRDDPNNQAMDDEVRVLQATGDNDQVIATYVNYSAHPTVLGSSNTSVTGDYVGRVAGLLEHAYGGFGMDQVGTLGRSQPARDGCHVDTTGMTQDQVSLCALDNYATRVAAKIQMALEPAHAQTLTGDAVVGMNSYFLNDPTTSAVLAGVVYAGQAIGVPAGRAANPPWYTGNLLGTTVYSGRIGDILINGGPGEFYPQIPLKVRDTVEHTTGAEAPKIQGVMNIGTAGDFLGYIIAPLEAYPQPIEASLVPPVGNDNYFFNISHTFGERLTCDLLRGAGDVLAGDPSLYWSQYDRCPAFINDFETPEGFDMTFPEQPDLSSVLTHM